MIFDVKMEGTFMRESRFVAGGHKTQTPAAMTYSYVMSRDAVRIVLTIASPNEICILACDIQNYCFLA